MPSNFSKRNIYVIKNKKVILKGNRNFKDGLWDVDLSPKPSDITQQQQKLRPTHGESNDICTINYIVQKDKTKLELAQYLHACVFSPSVTTLQACIRRGNFISWPGIEKLNFQSILGTTMATAKGHLNQERKNLQSTQIVKQNDEINNDIFPNKDSKCYHCYAAIIAKPEKGKTYSDQTGRFPYQSSRGNKYIFILYDFDSNAILKEAIKDRSASSLTKAWECAYNRLTHNGHQTQLHILDNEISEEFAEALKIRKYHIN